MGVGKRNAKYKFTQSNIRGFDVTIDELLSSEEIIEAAEKEKKENMKSFKNIIFGIIDLMSIIFLFIPLFGKNINGYIYLVTIFSINRIGKYIYLIIIGATILYGVAELIMSKFENKSVDKINSIISLGLTSIAIITFIATREPYIAFIEFWIFLIKIVVYIKQSK